MEHKTGATSPRPRILVVHESRIMRASITRHIKHRYDCVEATELESGWNMLQDDLSIDVVLVDLLLPREDGVAFVKRMAASPIARVAATPVIVIAGEDGQSANAVEEARQRAVAAGAVDFIGKTTGAAETLARINTAQRLAVLRRSLIEQQVAGTPGLPIDASAGIMTLEYLEVAGRQAFALATRGQGELAAVAIGIDDLAGVDERLGASLSPVIARELSVVVSRCLRCEDTLVALDTGRYLALMPAMDIAEVSAWVLRMQEKLAATVMRYQGEIVQVTACAGASSLKSDTPRDVKQLIEIAQRRLIEAMACGAGEFVGATPLPPAPAAPEEHDDGIDAALRLLDAGQVDQVKPNLRKLAVKLIPLLRLIEREFQMNFKLSRLKERSGGTRERAAAEN